MLGLELILAAAIIMAGLVGALYALNHDRDQARELRTVKIVNRELLGTQNRVLAEAASAADVNPVAAVIVDIISRPGTAPGGKGEIK